MIYNIYKKYVSLYIYTYVSTCRPVLQCKHNFCCRHLNIPFLKHILYKIYGTLKYGLLKLNFSVFF